ncbi:MAG: zf-HC2 domain-containing protein [Candidatus Marinimicrobia bacterium]|nr:zf-HC2 domain-containing protein [Candidatus Neomarinimicrobiota bacterium]MCF7828527.1 zf-HC2 domain-containing protein [Candidatus Neomarinimicrobiota bacterium]MCF7882050.1 zf-HC2 domain-containing protein [Candidatus Neomarinimicrobiota bacterium]
MNKSHNHQQTFQKLCDDISTDIDAELCDEVKEHLKDCPDCQVYVDTLRETVYLYRGAAKQDEDEGIPDDVSDRLFKVLKLDKIREDIKGDSL